MPARGKSKATAHQTAAVALGRAAGKTAAQISADTGLAKATVNNLTSGAEGKGVIDRIIAANPGMMQGLMESVVESLKADIAPASKLTPEQRFTARSQAVSVLQLGQPKVPDPPAAGTGAVPGGGVFLGDMLTHYRSIVMGAPMPTGAE
jgi:hypothetical protein